MIYFRIIGTQIRTPGKKLSGTQRRKRKLVREGGCTLSKGPQRFLKKAKIGGDNEINEELVTHEGNDDIQIALIGD